MEKNQIKISEATIENAEATVLEESGFIHYYRGSHLGLISFLSKDSSYLIEIIWRGYYDRTSDITFIKLNPIDLADPVMQMRCGPDELIPMLYEIFWDWRAIK